MLDFNVEVIREIRKYLFVGNGVISIDFEGYGYTPNVTIDYNKNNDILQIISQEDCGISEEKITKVKDFKRKFDTDFFNGIVSILDITNKSQDFFNVNINMLHQATKNNGYLLTQDI